jgi:hypothetical protein
MADVLGPDGRPTSDLRAVGGCGDDVGRRVAVRRYVPVYNAAMKQYIRLGEAYLADRSSRPPR